MTRKLFALLFSFSILLTGAIYANSQAAFSIDEPKINVYLEGVAGYNRYAFSSTKPSSISWKNGTGNFSFGASLGIKADRYVSAELGGIYTLKAKATDNSAARRFTNASVRPWYAYFAGKFSIPVSTKVNIFTKLGMGYQQCHDDANNIIIRKWGAMFGAGIAYHFNLAFYINGQWMRFTGKVKGGLPDTSAPNIFLLGIGYKFLI